MATMKMFRSDLLIEWLREHFADRRFSCLYCPINKECIEFAYDPLCDKRTLEVRILCDKNNAEEFKQAIIERFSTDVEVADWIAESEG